MQQQNVAPAQVAMHLQSLMMERPELDKIKAFYECKETFGGMHGVNKEDFGLIFDRVEVEVAKPLSRASYLLAEQERELKQELIEMVYQVEPDDPDHCRHLMGLVTKIRSERSSEFLSGIDGALRESVGGEIVAKVKSCWPERFEGFEYEE